MDDLFGYEQRDEEQLGLEGLGLGSTFAMNYMGTNFEEPKQAHELDDETDLVF